MPDQNYNTGDGLTTVDHNPPAEAAPGIDYLLFFLSGGEGHFTAIDWDRQDNGDYLVRGWFGLPTKPDPFIMNGLVPKGAAWFIEFGENV